MSLTSNPEPETEDLPEEEVLSAKRSSRINALILAAVFVVMTLAPDPYKLFAPLLFLIPALLWVFSRLHKSSGGPTLRSRDLPAPPPMPKPDGADPFSYTPKDPKDPRRYKPIG